MHKRTPKRPLETPVSVRVIVHLFTTNGRWSSLVQVEGSLHPAIAMRLAIRALRERLNRRIW